MLLEKLIEDVEARTGVSRVFQMILGASLLTNVMMAGAIMTMDRTVRTVMVPPEISKSFWVDGRTLSPEYLEQMGTWVISQFATVSSTSIDMQNAALLKLVHPSQHGELSVRFKLAANRLKAENLSRVFQPREVRINEKDQSLALIGTLMTWVGQNRVPADKLTAYVVGFHYDGSRTTVKELREADPANPWNPPSADQLAAAEAAAAQAVSYAESSSQEKANDPPAPAGRAMELPPAPPASTTASNAPLTQ